MQFLLLLIGLFALGCDYTPYKPVSPPMYADASAYIDQAKSTSIDLSLSVPTDMSNPWLNTLDVKYTGQHCDVSSASNVGVLITQPGTGFAYSSLLCAYVNTQSTAELHWTYTVPSQYKYSFRKYSVQVKVHWLPGDRVCGYIGYSISGVCVKPTVQFKGVTGQEISYTSATSQYGVYETVVLPGITAQAQGLTSNDIDVPLIFTGFVEVDTLLSWGIAYML